MKMFSFSRRRVMGSAIQGLLGLAFAAASTVAAASAPWYQGNFSGKADGTGEFVLTCETDGTCRLLIGKFSLSNNKDAPLTATKEGIDAGVPNANLDFTRRAVQADPGMYQKQEHSAFLTPMREILKSQDRFSACTEVKDKNDAMFGICSLTTDPSASHGLVLLLPTMNPMCRGLPFCAYLFVPLRRTAE